MTINSYPKIHSIGHPQVADLFNGPITIEEKIDGSQFSFGIDLNGQLMARSKGAQLIIEAPEKMFAKAIEIIKSKEHLLKSGYTYRGEYLQKPKHNSLAYDRIPQDHIMIYDINTGLEQYMSHALKKKEAEALGFETVPLIYEGPGDAFGGVTQLLALMDRVSVLGGAKIEGFVVKNYSKFTPDAKAMMGKYVSENFKEVHTVEWKKENPSNKDVLGLLVESYRNKARWQKGIIHLQEAGKLTQTPKDIAALLKEVQRDIEEECKEEIKEKLWNWAKSHILRGSIRGLPEYYKEHLLGLQFEKKEE